MNIDSSITDIEIKEGEVIKIETESGLLLWEKGGVGPTTSTPFYFENVGSDKARVYIYNASSTPTRQSMYYSSDGVDWKLATIDKDSKNYITIEINPNERVYLKNKSDVGYFSKSTTDSNVFSCFYEINVGGNIMSLIYNDFENVDSLKYDYVFYNLFTNCTKIVDASELLLPAMTLSNYCYYNMFYVCYSLTKAPSVLPATTLAENCYWQMFRGCKSLTQAPDLPATELKTYCYRGMFNGCTSLTSTPTLSSDSLADYCYYYMFYGCTSLTQVSTLPATTLKNHCYESMFQNCTSLTQAPTLPSTTLADYCYYHMFDGCTKLVTTPELPAPTLKTYCYGSMFTGCSNLNSVTTYASNISASSCLSYWLLNVKSSGTFYNKGGANYSKNSPSGIPSGWTEIK